MKTLLLIALIAPSLIAVSYKSFKRSKEPRIEINKMHIWYLEKTSSDIAAFDSMDALFSRTFLEYDKLKQSEYLRARAIGFNAPPAKDTYAQLLKILKAENLGKGDKALCKSIFRAAIIFRILDENTDPRFPSKQEVLKVFWKDVI